MVALSLFRVREGGGPPIYKSRADIMPQTVQQKHGPLPFAQGLEEIMSTLPETSLNFIEGCQGGRKGECREGECREGECRPEVQTSGSNED